MQFDNFEIDPALTERLSSWRKLPGVVQNRFDAGQEPGANETVIRVRQRNLGNMCLNTMQLHSAFYAQVEAFVQQEGRSPQHQQRVEDWAAFALGAYEQHRAFTGTFRLCITALAAQVLDSASLRHLTVQTWRIASHDTAPFLARLVPE